MYVPPAFREDRPDVLRDAMRAAGLVTLVTVTRAGPFASHLPLLLDAADGPHGTLHGHIARANPQWRDSRADLPALAIFAGPDAYVSPSWYPSKQEHGRVVPTWNYVTVHATGPVEFYEDADRLHALVTRLTEARESARVSPWAVSDAPADFVASQLRGIVGVALRIATLEGKWKLSQNRNAADQAGVVAGLEHEPDGAAVRDAMLARR
jgi:transcriptional regulator